MATRININIMINLKLKYPNGVSLELAIPLNLPASTQSTVVTPDRQEAPQEAASPDQETEYDITWSKASDQLSGALEKFENAEILFEGKGVGEDGEGDGRIGGMGERKEVGGQGEGREGETVSIYNFEFPTKQGIYTPPAALVKDFVQVYGEQNVLEEFLKARAWLTANEDKQKKLRGMGRFLNSWLCHQNGFKRTPIKSLAAAKTGSLIDDAKEVTQGW